MRYVLLPTLVIITLLRFCGTKQQQVPIALGQKEITARHSCDTLSCAQTNEAGVGKFSTIEMECESGPEQFVSKPFKNSYNPIAPGKIASEAAELTLEYIAVQLPRSHALR